MKLIHYRACNLLSQFTFLFFFPREGLKKPRKVRGPKCMPHFSAVYIWISLLFEENAIFCTCPGTINSLLCSFQCPVHLKQMAYFDPGNVQTPLKIVAYFQSM